MHSITRVPLPRIDCGCCDTRVNLSHHWNLSMVRLLGVTTSYSNTLHPDMLSKNAELLHRPITAA